MISILGDEVKTILSCILPQSGIGQPIELKINCMSRASKAFIKEKRQTRWQVVIYYELHAAGGIT